MLFTRPPILWLLLVCAVALGWFLVWSWRRKQALRVRFVAARLLPQLTARVSPAREKVRLALVFGAVLSLFLALAGPRWGFTWEEAHQRGLDIVVAIDTSRSMLARDLAPNRLARAQLAAYDLMRLARQDRMGLVAFAGVAFLQCPLTLDDEAFRQSVEALATDIIPQGGTAVAGAIDAALGAYKDENNFKTLVLLTDGEDHDEGALAAAERAKKAGLRIFTLGVGTPEGEVVQVTDEHGATSYVKDEQGNVVKSRLNEGLLQQIATITGGFYLPLRAARSIETLYEKGLAPLPKTEIASRLYKRFHERFYWPLGLALLLLMLEAVLPPGRRDPIPKAASAAAARGRVALGVLFALGVQTAAFASVGGALKDYDAGRYRESRQEFERLLEQEPDDARLHYNAGAAAYRAGQLGQAARSFTNALRSTDLTLQQRAFYNLGNTLYRVGEAEPEPQAKAQPWQNAVRSFEAALNLNPKDEDARANLAFVKKQLEQLQQQQQQQQQQQNQPSDDQQSDSSEKSENKPQPDSKPKSQPKPEEKPSQSEEQSPPDSSSESKPQPPPDSNDQQAGQDGAGRDQPQETESQPPSQAGQGQSGQETNAPNATAAAAGVMTPSQAQQLLDAQKSEERLFLFLPQESTNRNTDRVLKNW